MANYMGRQYGALMIQPTKDQLREIISNQHTTIHQLQRELIGNEFDMKCRNADWKQPRENLES